MCVCVCVCVCACACVGVLVRVCAYVGVHSTCLVAAAKRQSLFPFLHTSGSPP